MQFYAANHAGSDTSNDLHVCIRTAEDSCIRFDKLAVRCVADVIVHRILYSIPKVRICDVISVRSDDDVLIDYLIELVCDCVGVYSSDPLITDKIARKIPSVRGNQSKQLCRISATLPTWFACFPHEIR